jgi:hypothetical protein
MFDLCDDFGASHGSVIQFAPELLVIIVHAHIAIRFVLDDVSEDVHQHDVLFVHLHDHFLHFQTLRHDCHPVAACFMAVTGTRRKSLIAKWEIGILVSPAQVSTPVGLPLSGPKAPACGARTLIAIGIAIGRLRLPATTRLPTGPSDARRHPYANILQVARDVR